MQCISNNKLIYLTTLSQALTAIAIVSHFDADSKRQTNVTFIRQETLMSTMELGEGSLEQDKRGKTTLA